MKYLCVFLLYLFPLPALAAVNVFACEPEWASLAEEIGGDKVTAFAATSARQDPHHIRARPSLIAKARDADLILCSGAGLEVGWLPLLLQKAGANVQPGKPGYLEAASVVTVLEKPTGAVDRSMGDVHPEGNPHVQLDPHNIALVARELTARLSAIDAENASYYQGRGQAFDTRWQSAIKGWEARAAKLKDAPVVVHHRSFVYLLHWLGMKEVAALEPKPGIAPSMGHLENLLLQLEASPARIILRSSYDPAEASQWLSEKTGTPAIVLPYTVGGDEQSSNLFSLFDRSVTLLTEAYAQR